MRLATLLLTLALTGCNGCTLARELGPNNGVGERCPAGEWYNDRGECEPMVLPHGRQP